MFFIALSNNAFSQQNLDEIAVLLKRGDTENITKKLDEKVEVSILNNDSYTVSEAKVILNQFFADKTNSNFVAIHKGTCTNADANYQIGELRTGKETYRTYVYSKNVNGNFLVKELRIERM